MATDDFFSHVDRRMWGDAKVKALDPIEKLVWCWLLNNTQHTQVPGVFRCWAPMVADEVGIPLRRARACLAKLAEVGMVKHDPKTGLTWLPNALKRRTVRSPDNVRAWKKDFGALPECDLRHEIAKTFAETFSTKTETFAEAWREVAGIDGVTPAKSRTSASSADTHDDTHPGNKGGTENKDQEKDKDQEEDQGGAHGPPTVVSVDIGKTPFQREVVALLIASPDLQADRPAPDWERAARAIEALAMGKSSPKRVRQVLPYVLERLGVMRASSPREGGPKGGMGFVLPKLEALVVPGAFEAEQRKFAPKPVEHHEHEDDDDLDLDDPYLFPREVRRHP